MEAEECATEVPSRFAFTHEENPTPDWSTEVLQRSETKRKNERLAKCGKLGLYSSEKRLQKIIECSKKSPFKKFLENSLFALTWCD